MSTNHWRKKIGSARQVKGIILDNIHLTLNAYLHFAHNDDPKIRMPWNLEVSTKPQLEAGGF